MIIVDYRTCERSIAALFERGMKVIKSFPVPCLYEAVKGHPDMQLHPLGDGRVICAPEVYGYYRELLDAELICGSVPLSGSYPGDIAYNAAAVGEYVICNAKYTAPEILDAYTAMGKSIISVRQGYAKCSAAVVSDDALITADAGIYEAMKGRKDVLLIREGHITLEPLPYGFIGGCTGLISGNLLAVNGSIDLHPDGAAIRKFCEKHGTELLCLNDAMLCDIGTIIRV